MGILSLIRLKGVCLGARSSGFMFYIIGSIGRLTCSFGFQERELWFPCYLSISSCPRGKNGFLSICRFILFVNIPEILTSMGDWNVTFIDWKSQGKKILFLGDKRRMRLWCMALWFVTTFYIEASIYLTYCILMFLIICLTHLIHLWPAFLQTVHLIHAWFLLATASLTVLFKYIIGNPDEPSAEEGIREKVLCFVRDKVRHFPMLSLISSFFPDIAEY